MNNNVCKRCGSTVDVMWSSNPEQPSKGFTWMCNNCLTELISKDKT